MKFRKVTFLSLLSHIIDNRGKTCPISKIGIPLIATNCIKNENLHPVYEKVRYVDKETYKNWFRGHPKQGDIIFVTKGSPGQTNWVPDQVDFCIAQDMVSLRVNEKLVYPKYLFAILRSKKVQQMIESMHVGTLIPHFKKGDFDKLILDIPEDYGEQKWIGDLYFQFCEKIEKNILMNKTLEEMAMAIYKEWFVDFGPFRDGEFVDSELGPIPKGWEVMKIGKLFDYVIGGDWGKEKQELDFNQETKIIRGTDISTLESGGIHGIPNRFLKERNFNKRQLIDGDLIIEISGGSTGQPTGRSLYITQNYLVRLKGKVVPASFCRLLRPVNRYNGVLLAVHLKYLYKTGGTWFYQNQSTGISNFQFKFFSEKELVPIPRDEQILLRFYRLIRPLYDKISSNENIYLEKTRDYLLPKLISGEVRVKVAEEKLKEVL